MKKKPHNPELRRVLMEIVDNQLRDGTPPETRVTLDRLMTRGFSRAQALELIACVVSSEIFDILKSGQLYDEERYLAGLRALPKLPWDGEEPNYRSDHFA
jgi:hypothetical protein